MTGNERSMIFELASSVARLTDAIKAISPSVSDASARAVIDDAAEGATAGIQAIIRLIDKEWLNRE